MYFLPHVVSQQRKKWKKITGTGTSELNWKQSEKSELAEKESAVSV